MRNRILEISENPARLRVQRKQLIVESSDRETSIPIEDIAMVVAGHPQVTYTQAVLNELLENGGCFVTCDEKRLPSGMLLSLKANVLQSERFQTQFHLSAPRKKQLWKQIVIAKIRMQARLLEKQLGSDFGLIAMCQRVKSGDPTCVEGQAAKKYWSALFGSDFRRDRDAEDHNSLLNYGYTVLRAATARAVVAAGLHPTVGIHHRNKYNNFCLADDVIEPYRPLVDLVVTNIMHDRETVPELKQEVRAELLGVLTSSLRMESQTRSLFDCLGRSAASLVNAMADANAKLVFPEDFSDEQTST